MNMNKDDDGGGRTQSQNSNPNPNPHQNKRIKGKSCMGTIFYSSQDKSESKKPICLGFIGTLEQGCNYILNKPSRLQPRWYYLLLFWKEVCGDNTLSALDDVLLAFCIPNSEYKTKNVLPFLSVWFLVWLNFNLHLKG